MIVNRNSEDVSLKGEKISSGGDQHQISDFSKYILKKLKKKSLKIISCRRDMTSWKTVPK